MIICVDEIHVFVEDLTDALPDAALSIACRCRKFVLEDGVLRRTPEDPGLPEPPYEITPLGEGPIPAGGHHIAGLSVAETKAALLGIKRSPEGWVCKDCGAKTDVDGRGDHYDGCPKAPVGYLRRDT